MPTLQPKPLPPLRCCLLSGGASQRMGQDKALLPHPAGDSWLEHTLLLLAELEAPITLLSRWPQHQTLAEALQLPQLETLAEPPPWEGPLLALHRLMERYPNARLLLAPVDMPHLNTAALRTLLVAAAMAPERIHLAHDGDRSQPLLGVYPSPAAIRSALATAISGGERRLLRWLDGQPCNTVPLPAAAIRNVNSPAEL
jgi:molybdopterin-guanine dinucleotide biosynthesis protein A